MTSEVSSRCSSPVVLFQGIDEAPPPRWKLFSHEMTWTREAWSSDHIFAKTFRTVSWVGGLGVPLLELAAMELLKKGIIVSVINPAITLANRIDTWAHQEEGHSRSISIIDVDDVRSFSSASDAADDEASPGAVARSASSGSITGESVPSQYAYFSQSPRVEEHHEQKSTPREILNSPLKKAARDATGIACVEQSDSSSFSSLENNTEEQSDYKIPRVFQKGWIYQFFYGKPEEKQ